MKTIFCGLLLAISASAIAQTAVHSNLSTSINDDDKTYSIRIDGDRNGKEIHYNRTFNVVGMSTEQKESLKNRVLDSLGLGEAPPALPRPATEATTKTPAGVETVTFTCATCTGKTKLSVNGNGFLADREVAIEKGKPGFPFDLDMPPGDYRYTYRQNGVEQMQLPFTVKAGQTNTVVVK